MSEAGYVIMVGRERPAKAIVAQVDKNGEPKGERLERFISVGKHLIMNVGYVWGKRVIDGKEPKNEKGESVRVETTDAKYRGEIKFLDWGADGGYAILCRYIPQSASLDVEYQDNIQKIKLDKDENGAQMELDAGENKFDPKTEALKISWLKVNPQNRDSRSKNPDPRIKGFSYYEVTDETYDKTSVTKMESRIDAGYLVKSLSTKPRNIRNLFEIMGKRDEFGDTNHLSNDSAIYKTLLVYAENRPTEFFAQIEAYKRDLSDNFEKAKSFNAFDLTKDGVIAVTSGGKKELVYTDLEGKGEVMLDYIMANYYDEAIYKQTKTFKVLMDKIK